METEAERPWPLIEGCLTPHLLFDLGKFLFHARNTDQENRKQVLTSAMARLLRGGVGKWWNFSVRASGRSLGHWNRPLRDCRAWVQTSLLCFLARRVSILFCHVPLPLPFGTVARSPKQYNFLIFGGDLQNCQPKKKPLFSLLIALHIRLW